MITWYVVVRHEDTPGYPPEGFPITCNADRQYSDQLAKSGITSKSRYEVIPVYRVCDIPKKEPDATDGKTVVEDASSVRQ